MTDLHIVLAYVFMSQASCQADERSLAYNWVEQIRDIFCCALIILDWYISTYKMYCYIMIYNDICI